MALIRPALPPSIDPTPERLRALMVDYGLSRKTVARLMRCSEATVARYLLPESNKYAQQIPIGRFELFLIKLRATVHPDQPITVRA